MRRSDKTANKEVPKFQVNAETAKKKENCCVSILGNWLLLYLQWTMLAACSDCEKLAIYEIDERKLLVLAIEDMKPSDIVLSPSLCYR